MFVEHKEVGEAQDLDEASMILRAAANLIERNGWCQHEMYSDGRYCVVGAIGVAGNYQPAAYVARDRFSAAIGVRMVADWNDAPGRTKKEVVAKLREVAGQ